MRRNNALDSMNLVRAERRRWQEKPSSCWRGTQRFPEVVRWGVSFNEREVLSSGRPHCRHAITSTL